MASTSPRASILNTTQKREEERGEDDDDEEEEEDEEDDDEDEDEKAESKAVCKGGKYSCTIERIIGDSLHGENPLDNFPVCRLIKCIVDEDEEEDETHSRAERFVMTRTPNQPRLISEALSMVASVSAHCAEVTVVPAWDEDEDKEEDEDEDEDEDASEESEADVTAEEMDTISTLRRTSKIQPR